MIDVDTYRMLPAEDREAIDAWLAELGPLVTEIPRYSTEIEMVSEGGRWRIRHESLDRHGRVIINGDEIHTVDSVLDVESAPTVLLAFGPGSEPPPASFLVRWRP